MYTAIVLDQESRTRLIQAAQEQGYLQADWELVCHHITLRLGRLPELARAALVGTSVFNVPVTKLGMSELAVAAAVDLSDTGLESKNAVPHVTISVNRVGGGKPKDSNSIKSWVEVQDGLTISGTVEECM